MPQPAQQDDTVRIHFVGKLKDGTIIDATEENDPLEFRIGSAGIFQPIEDAVVGMEVGETKTAEIPAEEAFGPFQNDKVVEVPKEQFNADAEPEAGQRFRLTGEQGDMIVTVVDVGDTNLTIDTNHPLAGKDLIFEIKLLEIVAA